MAEPLAKKLCQENQPQKQNILRKEFINPSEIKRALLNDVKEPLVFQGILLQPQGEAAPECNGTYWKCMKWDVKSWGSVIGDKPLHFRIGPQVGSDNVLCAPQWETSSLKGNMTYQDFLEWAEGGKSCRTICSQEVDASTHWAYFDYVYMQDLENAQKMEGLLDWSLFGFPGRGIHDSTLWIGTKGANTPCHIDTYGCNLVAQIVGRKRWVLFPKSQSQYLSPTRIPYEESSIYSRVGFPRPCLKSHPELCSTTPYVVTLEPGDVLFVPHHWWHFVENLEFSISINTWLELPSDDNERVKEAFVLYQVGSLCQGVESVDDISSVFNPNMIDVATKTSSDLLKLLANTVFKQSKKFAEDASPANSDDFVESDKISSVTNRNHHANQSNSSMLEGSVSTSSDTGNHLLTLNWDNIDWCAAHGIEKVPKMSFDTFVNSVLGSDIKTEYEKSSSEKETKLKENQVSDDNTMSVSLQYLEILINTLTDDRVISVIKEVFDEKLQKDRGGLSVK